MKREETVVLSRIATNLRNASYVDRSRIYGLLLPLSKSLAYISSETIFLVVGQLGIEPKSQRRSLRAFHLHHSPIKVIFYFSF